MDCMRSIQHTTYTTLTTCSPMLMPFVVIMLANRTAAGRLQFRESTFYRILRSLRPGALPIRYIIHTTMAGSQT